MTDTPLCVAERGVVQEDLSPEAEAAVLALTAGCKVACPICEKRVMFQSYQSLSGSGIGQHIRSAHPQFEKAVFRVTKMQKNRAAAAAKAAEIEKAARPLRQHVVSGAFLDEVVGEIESLIGMMEPYYSQGNAADDAYDLVKRIEEMQTVAATLARAGDA